MVRRELLAKIRPSLSDTAGLTLVRGEGDPVLDGEARSEATNTAYPIRDGCLDLLGGRPAIRNLANLSNFLPGAARAYEPLWRVRSLTLLTGEEFPNRREVEIISELAQVDRGGLYLDLGCSAGLYTRELALRLGDSGHVAGIDISPSMLREAARRAREAGAEVSLIRADAENLPFAPRTFDGVVCGGTLNELGHPGRALREVSRVLKPGGRLAIMGLLRAGSAKGRLLQRICAAGGAKFFSAAQIRRLLADAGLAPEELRTCGVVFFAGARRISF
ncbi:class I SAM-dependent methyltransferase [Rubrobacter taiwanensis]|jgi:SAM-dependent methyltransferase|uniref:Class I SAM-dependent methyltransferase n=1 Tax=Rubrobacter taiwanensis TaxID=185139 RepID=A0A4R1B8R6_9ACTN|nr:class I SAM-dependent methyltransferase [Rubrobacter taiwanensis]TCJ13215.1 class I SAM-dependent methyltransferase [Rubrobacter taiwanensis]